MKKKKLSKKKLKQRQESAQLAAEQCGNLLKEMNPSEPASPMMGIAAQLERDMFQPGLPSPGTVSKTLVEVAAAADKAKKEDEVCECLKVVGGLVLAAGVLTGLFFGGRALYRNHVYSDGNCFSQSKYSNAVTARITHNGSMVNYEYVDIIEEDVGNKQRSEDSFREAYSEQIDCAEFFDRREGVNEKNTRKRYVDYLEELREELRKEKAKNANRAGKR